MQASVSVSVYSPGDARQAALSPQGRPAVRQEALWSNAEGHGKQMTTPLARGQSGICRSATVSLAKRKEGYPPKQNLKDECAAQALASL